MNVSLCGLCSLSICSTRIKQFLIYCNLYIRFQLNVQNAVSPQPCGRKLGISLVLLNFLGCNCGW